MAMVGRFARRLRDHEDQTLPLPAGPVSNGEFVPASPDSRAMATNALIRSVVDDTAKRLGVDRRRFLQSAGAVAASLAAFELVGCAGPVLRTIVEDNHSRSGRHVRHPVTPRHRRLPAGTHVQG